MNSARLSLAPGSRIGVGQPRLPGGEDSTAEQAGLDILLVSTADVGGGAEQSAWNLFKAYRARGHRSWMAVGRKHSYDPNVALIPNDSCRNPWAKAWLRAAARMESMASAAHRLYRWLDIPRSIAEPRRWLGVMRGHEDFEFPGTGRLLRLFGVPDLVHCYNLHGNYFDLRELSGLSRQVPVLLDLRDAWLLSGHCAHSFECQRWQEGCGSCPDLNIYPPIRRDATAFNWQRKKGIFGSSRLYVAAPSRWLMEKVARSMLAPAIIESRVIPTGIDLTLYRPGEKQAARGALNLPPGATMLLFAATGIRRHLWKDHEMLRAVIGRVAEHMPERSLLFVGLGEQAPAERVGGAEIRFVAHQKDAATVVRYYQAADLYLHPARADTFPRVVIEAIACGLPVVATAVGGIPEQIKTLAVKGGEAPPEALGRWGVDRATGTLVPAGAVEAMTVAVEQLVKNDALRLQLGANARRDARERFDLQLQVDRYLKWYGEIVGKRQNRLSSAASSRLPKRGRL
jgi:glycosyltransferase involved in cell wall biosynthesis